RSLHRLNGSQAGASHRRLPVQEVGEPVKGVEEIDLPAWVVVIAVGICRIDAMGVIAPLMPVKTVPGRARLHHQVVGVLHQVPEGMAEDPCLDAEQPGSGQRTPTWVRDCDDDGLGSAFLACDLNGPKSTESALGLLDPSIELLRAQRDHACLAAAVRCSFEISPQMRSASTGD